MQGYHITLLKYVVFVVKQSVTCSSCNTGASVYISGKSLVPMLQLIYSTWVNHLQVYIETAGTFCECIYMGPCDFRLWVTS